MKKTYTFIEILDDERGRELIDQIEELIGEEEAVLVRIREDLIKELKTEFGYDYIF